MTAHTLQHFGKQAWFSLVASMAIVAMTMLSFVLAEPQISHSQVTRDFYVRQTITDETTFLVDPGNVTMAGDINGVTGGNATGTSQFVVQSNNSSGYIVEISFFDNAGSYAMYGDADGDESIRDYDGDVAGEPSYGFTASSAALFGYTVAASTTSDIDQSFQHNGSNACNTGSNTTPDTCWKAPETSNFTIIDRGSAAINGATSSIKFKVNVPSGAVPVPSAQTYTATATLTLTAQ